MTNWNYLNPSVNPSTVMSEDFIQYVDLKRWPIEETVWFLTYAVAVVIVVWAWAWNKQRPTK